MSRRLLAFPNPVNEVSARLVATGVVAMAVIELTTSWRPLLFVMTYGFIARVLTGPTLSPLGQIVTRVVTPRVPWSPRYVPGPPKRFAQAIGATFASLATVAWLSGALGVSDALVALLLVAASFEAFAGYCLGCKAFAFLMRAHVIPERVCLDCADISRRLSASRTA